jgi:hypothetical protein
MLDLQRLTHAWSHATLQREYWGLFRTPPTKSIFPAVEVAWNEVTSSGPTRRRLLLRSFEEPDDPIRGLMLNPQWRWFFPEPAGLRSTLTSDSLQSKYLPGEMIALFCSLVFSPAS